MVLKRTSFYGFKPRDPPGRLAIPKRQSFWSSRAVLILLGLAALLQGTLGDNCDAVPISLSNFKFCENGSCYFDQQISAAIPLFDDSSLCMEFVSPDDKNFAFPVNISVLHAHYHWDVDYYYYTDDPFTDTALDCSCPGGSQLSCSSCPVAITAGDVVLCKAGVSSDKECALAWTGAKTTWCFTMGVTGKNRFKIIKFKGEPVLDVSLRVETNDYTWVVDYSGEIIAYETNTTSINVTLVSDTAKILYTPEFVLFDNHDSSDFYLLEDDLINGLNEHTYTKIGWFKSGKGDDSVGSDLIDDIFLRIDDCHKLDWQFKLPWASTVALLNANKNKLSSAILPNSVLFDPKFKPNPSDANNGPTHIVGNYNYLKDGWMLTNFDGPEFVGVGINDNLLTPGIQQPLSSPTYIKLLTTKGLFNTSDWLLDSSFYLYEPITDDALRFYFYIYPAESAMAVCFTRESESWGMKYCNNTKFLAYLWPSRDIYELWFDGSFRAELHDPANETVEETYLVTEIGNGVLNVNVKFLNLEVIFESFNIKPKINSLRSTKTNLTVNAYSLTVSGSCYIHTIPVATVLTQTLTLTVSPTDYIFDFNVGEFKGVLKVSLRCYKNEASMNTTVNINTTSTPVQEQEGGGDGDGDGPDNGPVLGGDNDPTTSSEFLWSFWFNPLNWIKRNFWPSLVKVFSWYHWIVISFEFIGLLCGLIVSLWLIWMLVKLIAKLSMFMRSKMRFSRGKLSIKENPFKKIQ